MYRAVTYTGYQFVIKSDSMDTLVIAALHYFITQRRDVVWEGLNPCHRTSPSAGACLCTYAACCARPPGDPKSMLGHYWTSY